MPTFTPRMQPLTFSTTDLEYFLSTTETPWPGDADLVVLTGDRGRARAVVEFKKHNLTAPLEDHTFVRYYRPADQAHAESKTSDRLKWDRLAWLAKRLAPSEYRDWDADGTEGRPFAAETAPIPLVAIYYPTSDAHRYVVLDRIVGEPGMLTSVGRARAALPSSADPDSALGVVEAVNELL